MVCAVVGAIVLYCAMMAAVWAMVVRTVRRVGGRARSRSRPALVSPVPVAAAGSAGAAAAASAADRRAKSWSDLPAWLFRDRPWAVAVVLLGAPPIRDLTADFIDFAQRKINWHGLIVASGGWPADQRLLVQTAYELAFDSSGEMEPTQADPVTLADMMRLLDDEQQDRVRVAMDVRRGRVEVGEALTRLGR
jgi:hypothetical protein